MGDGEFFATAGPESLLRGEGNSHVLLSGRLGFCFGLAGKSLIYKI